ncbi:MAG: hypothetical protein HYR66_12570 [Sphingobacteriales bacterium]|nr:hypothetical protein [Sphingobacteriales bacterium]MBI3717344.1 hypothetical protein [Sphingobacteriales bacterium]
MKTAFSSFLVIVFLAILPGVSAQTDSASMIVLTNQVVPYKNIIPNIYFFSDHQQKLPVKEVARIVKWGKLTDSIPNRINIPKKFITANNYFKFFLHNNTDSLQSFCFNPGNYFDVFEIYKQQNDSLTENTLFTKVDVKDFVLNHGFKLIQIRAGETITFIIKLHYVKTTVISVNPRLVKAEYSRQQLTNELNFSDVQNIITFIVSGFFLMMIFYSFISYRHGYRPEFLFYGFYTLCISSLIFLKTILYGNSTWFNHFFEGYFDFLIQLASVYLYLFFVRSYLNTKLNYPFINKLLRYSQWIVMGATVIYTYIFFGTNYLSLQNQIEFYTKIYLLLLGIIFVSAGFRYKDRLLKYLVYGNIILIVFGLISFVFSSTPFRLEKLHWIFSSGLFYYDLGVLGECILFMMGLSYKNRIELIEKVKMQEAIKREEERREMEKQLTIIQTQQEERNRISADMHDELGAGMTAIRLMSEMAKAKTANQPIPEIDKISDSANDLLNKMNAIIWSMISSNDTLPNLVSYIRSYAQSYFETLDMKCKVDIADDVPELELSGEKRRNIFLTVKEALNNVVKHAKASEVQLNFSFEKNICIKIIDNGVGINEDKIREFGNGLKNMRKRMERIGGTFMVTNNNGTHIQMCIPFDK